MMDMLVSGTDAMANTMDKVGLGFDDSEVLVNANVNWRERGREGERGKGRETQIDAKSNKQTNKLC
jgi:hypothetical protein